MRHEWRATGTMMAAVLGVLIGQVSAKENPASEPSKLVQELDMLGEQVNRALVEGRYEDVLAFYADDATVMPNGTAKRVGKKALEAGMQADRKHGVVFETFMTRTERAWECDGLVYSVGTYAFSASTPETPRPVADRGKFFSVWRRDVTGRLLVLYDIWNTDIEPGK